MALREKRVVQSVLVCDYCGTDIEDQTGTHIEGQASGYMKRETLGIDLCENCAQKVGLKRRGRRPGSTNVTVATEAAPAAPKKRGRPRKVTKPEKAEPELVAVAVGSDSDWEN